MKKYNRTIYEEKAVWLPLVRELISLIPLLPDYHERGFEIGKSVESNNQFLDYVNKLNPRVREYLYRFELPDIEGIAETEEEKELVRQTENWKRTQYTYARYEDLLTASWLFTNLAERNQRQSFLAKYGGVDHGFQFSDQKRNYHPGFYSDESGFIRSSMSQLPEMFKKYDIDYKRVRFCAVCERIYWVKKANTDTCGRKECAKNLYNWKRLAKKKGEDVDLNIERLRRRRKSRLADKLKRTKQHSNARSGEEKRRKYYFEKEIDYCPTCIRPLKTCECK